MIFRFGSYNCDASNNVSDVIDYCSMLAPECDPRD